MYMFVVFRLHVTIAYYTKGLTVKYEIWTRDAVAAGKRKLCYCNSRSNIVTHCLKTAISITSNCNKVIRILSLYH